MLHDAAKADGPADDAAVLYFGEVMHARLKPVGHRFSYRVMSLLIDLDRLEAADRQSPLFDNFKRRVLTALDRSLDRSLSDIDPKSTAGEAMWW